MVIIDYDEKWMIVVVPPSRVWDPRLYFVLLYWNNPSYYCCYYFVSYSCWCGETTMIVAIEQIEMTIVIVLIADADAAVDP